MTFKSKKKKKKEGEKGAQRKDGPSPGGSVRWSINRDANVSSSSQQQPPVLTEATDGGLQRDYLPSCLRHVITVSQHVFLRRAGEKPNVERAAAAPGAAFSCPPGPGVDFHSLVPTADRARLKHTHAHTHTVVCFQKGEQQEDSQLQQPMILLHDNG